MLPTLTPISLGPKKVVECRKKLTYIAWLELAKSDPATLSNHSEIYFCEDHFDVLRIQTKTLQFSHRMCRKKMARRALGDREPMATTSNRNTDFEVRCLSLLFAAQHTPTIESISATPIGS
ncbi:hypothetical protein evm_010504 [Chilo suppressalis]|nr:hypothetical protein evm_010504 [Chilo suppressalis]